MCGSAGDPGVQVSRRTTHLVRCTAATLPPPSLVASPVHILPIDRIGAKAAAAAGIAGGALQCATKGVRAEEQISVNQHTWLTFSLPRHERAVLFKVHEARRALAGAQRGQQLGVDAAFNWCNGGFVQGAACGDGGQVGGGGQAA